MNKTINKNYFHLNKKLYGKDSAIKLTLPDGSIYKYMHDDVYDSCLPEFLDESKKRSSFKKYGKWTDSKRIPVWILNKFPELFKIL